MKQPYFLIVFLFFASCIGHGSGGKKAENTIDPFWEGVISPGLFTGKYYDDSNAANLTYTIYEELTINIDHTYQLRRKTTGLYGGRQEIELFTGDIEKHSEIYNGEKHVWYTFEGISVDRLYNGMAIETNGNAIHGAHLDYSVLARNISRNYYWVFTKDESSFISSFPQNASTPKTKTVFVYDGGRIELYDDNHKAVVNGQSGTWIRVDDSPSFSPYCSIASGGKNIMVCLKNGKVFFGTVQEARENANNPSLWHEYHVHRE